MMGDNRDNSQDSRYWGFMPARYVKGKALFVYFSFGDAGGLARGCSNIRWGRMLHQIRGDARGSMKTIIKLIIAAVLVNAAFAAAPSS